MSRITIPDPVTGLPIEVEAEGADPASVFAAIRDLSEALKNLMNTPPNWQEEARATAQRELTKHAALIDQAWGRP